MIRILEPQPTILTDLELALLEMTDEQLDAFATAVAADPEPSPQDSEPDAALPADDEFEVLPTAA